MTYVVEKISQSRGWQLLLIIALILIVPLTVDINRRISVIRRMRDEEARLSQEIAEAWDNNEKLKAQLQFVNQPAYLERWARVDARMARPDEVAIIPVYQQSPQLESPGRVPNSPATDTALSISEQWHRLFFGAPATP